MGYKHFADLDYYDKMDEAETMLCLLDKREGVEPSLFLSAMR